jgi:hypothetical protein
MRNRFRHPVRRTWKDGGVTRPTTTFAMLVTLLLAAPMLVPSAALGHGGMGEDFRTRILSIEPSGLPVDVRITDGDEVRFENAGDELLVVCGYEDDGACEEWVRIGEDGVYVDRNARSYHANVDETEFGAIPQDAGTREEWALVRERPRFYAYHDHRVHWMGASLPPNVDAGDPSPQRVFDSEVRFRYGDVDGVVKTRLEYVGGSTWLQRNGERMLLGGGVAAMLVVFAVDARRRRRSGAREDVASGE